MNSEFISWLEQQRYNWRRLGGNKWYINMWNWNFGNGDWSWKEIIFWLA